MSIYNLSSSDSCKRRNPFFSHDQLFEWIVSINLMIFGDDKMNNLFSLKQMDLGVG